MLQLLISCTRSGSLHALSRCYDALMCVVNASCLCLKGKSERGCE